MRALILAAGRGERMRPLTDHTPKPLLEVGGNALIEHLLIQLRNAGYRRLVINLGHLGAQIPARLGRGERWGVWIDYSQEPPGALETAGGIRQALPLLGREVFLVVNGDIWSDHPLIAPVLRAEDHAHLVLVPNPEHHPEGDFALAQGRVRLPVNRARAVTGSATAWAELPQSGQPSAVAGSAWTFSGIGWYRPELFAAWPAGRRPLAPVLRAAISEDRVAGELYRGVWSDIGTPKRLAALQDQVAHLE